MSTKTHIELGNELKLFFFDPVSPGSCFFLPHGAVMHQKLINHVRKYYRKMNYKEVVSPNIYDKKLWITSGHWEKYRENMFLLQDKFTDSDEAIPEGEEHIEFSLKAMNCPGHCVIFNKMNLSHKQLPLRLAEFGVLHRNELSGSLRGLTRVRRFQQDDAHIFCSLDQVEAEIQEMLRFIDELYVGMGCEYQIEVSTRPEKFIGDEEVWNRAEEVLKKVVATATKKDPVINEGDGAFYGPKIDISIKDSLDRWHQCATVQLDFNLPERFGLKYAGADQTLKQPIMIHRAFYGSLERFIAIMLEHTQGKLPLWMSPRQVLVLPIRSIHRDYAYEVASYLDEFEVEVNDSDDDLRQKIKEGEVMKFNYILVLGDREVKDKTVAVRTRDVKGIKVMSLEEFRQILSE